MTDSRMKLNTMLEYWVRHNQEHEQEFRAGAANAATFSAHAAEQLIQAADKMAEANGLLAEARKALAQGREV